MKTSGADAAEIERGHCQTNDAGYGQRAVSAYELVRLVPGCALV